MCITRFPMHVSKSPIATFAMRYDEGFLKVFKGSMAMQMIRIRLQIVPNVDMTVCSIEYVEEIPRSSSDLDKFILIFNNLFLVLNI